MYYVKLGQRMDSSRRAVAIDAFFSMWVESQGRFLVKNLRSPAIFSSISFGYLGFPRHASCCLKFSLCSQR